MGGDASIIGLEVGAGCNDLSAGIVTSPKNDG